MSQDRLRTIPGPDGRKGYTTSSALEESLQKLLQSGGSPAEGQSHIVVLGNPDRNPISRLWAQNCRFAFCLPNAYRHVLIELSPQSPEPANTDILSERFHRLTRTVQQLPSSTQIEAPPFLPALAPRHLRADDGLRRSISAASDGVDQVVSMEIQAGLYQMHDCLDDSHTCSQCIEGEGRHRTGDYWHAIMHRREPDYGNAKYWFRSVGEHPVFEKLPEIARRVIQDCSATGLDRLTMGNWDPFLFVDLCEKHAVNENSTASLALRAIQGWEMALLLEYSA